MQVIIPNVIYSTFALHSPPLSGAYSAPPGPAQNNMGPSVPSLPQVPTSGDTPTYS